MAVQAPSASTPTTATAQDDLDLPHPKTIRTADPSEARVRTQAVLGCSHRMTVLERARPFLAEIQHRSLAGMGLMSSSYGAAVEIDCSPPVGMVTVNFVLDGRMHIADGGDSALADPRHAAVFSFHEDLAMRWAPGTRQLMLTIDKARVERHLRNLLAQPLRRPLEFQPSADLADGGRAIATAVWTLRRALQLCGKAGPPPVLAAELEHGVQTALLLGQRHNYTEAIYAQQPLPSPRIVRRVVELIDSAPQTPFTVADLAGFAGVSERSLHAAFRRQLGTSPMSYLRRRRLDQAHDELLALDADAGVKVADVALRHGFAHASRFAAAYRQRFGEPPSATLRR